MNDNSLNTKLISGAQSNSNINTKKFKFDSIDLDENKRMY